MHQSQNAFRVAIVEKKGAKIIGTSQQTVIERTSVSSGEKKKNCASVKGL